MSVGDDINCSSRSVAELEAALNTTDRSRHPEQYAILVEALERSRERVASDKSATQPVFTSRLRTAFAGDTPLRDVSKYGLPLGIVAIIANLLVSDSHLGRTAIWVVTAIAALLWAWCLWRCAYNEADRVTGFFLRASIVAALLAWATAAWIVSRSA